ncbi:hypothetical protein APED_19145 [Acanthopleuribacter pedis]
MGLALITPAIPSFLTNLDADRGRFQQCGTHPLRRSRSAHAPHYQGVPLCHLLLPLLSDLLLPGTITLALNYAPISSLSHDSFTANSIDFRSPSNSLITIPTVTCGRCKLRWLRQSVYRSLSPILTASSPRSSTGNSGQYMTWIISWKASPSIFWVNARRPGSCADACEIQSIGKSSFLKSCAKRRASRRQVFFRAKSSSQSLNRSSVSSLEAGGNKPQFEALPGTHQPQV